MEFKTFDQFNQEKQVDKRLQERELMNGKVSAAEINKKVSETEDCSNLAETVNLSELWANDNPKHFARNLPTLETKAPQPFEEIEFEEAAARLNFEQ